MEMLRAYSVLNVKSFNDDQRLLSGYATTPQTDRDGDILDPFGAIFAAEIPLLWQHKKDSPVGHAAFGKPSVNGIPYNAKIVSLDEPGELKNLLDRAWQSVKTRLVRGVSIGFIPGEYERLKTGGRLFKTFEIIELSLVTIPSNTRATIESIKAFSQGNSQSVYGIPLVDIHRPKPDLAGAIQLLK